MCKTEENKVALDRLEIGKYQFDFELHSDYFQTIEKGFLLGGDVCVHAELDLRAKDYDLGLKVSGRVSVTCDRCLEAMVLEVEEEEMLDHEEDAKELDLNWLAYEMIVINLPTVHCHPEGGCNAEMAALLQNHLCRTEEEPEDTSL